MEQKDKIAVMMEEYKTIRAELLQRNTVLNSVFTVCGTVGAGAIGLGIQYGPSSAADVITVVVLVLALAGFTWFEIDKEARRAGRHLAELEKEVNRRADNETLLS